jgi:hypothetical protein
MFLGALIPSKTPAVNFPKNFETFPIGSGENKQRHNSKPKKHSAYEQEIPSWRSLIHHRIHRRQQLSADSNRPLLSKP